MRETRPVGLADQLQAGLTNVVVAALKEAFDRDRARLEMERAHLEEQRLRAEAAMRLEMRRQAAEREAGRLRLLAGMALIGWLASIAVIVIRGGQTTAEFRIIIGIGSLLLLSALGCAFYAYGRIPDPVAAETRIAPDPTSTAAIWLLLSGLTFAAASLLF